MKLYNLSEDDIIEVINTGERELISSDKSSFIASLNNNDYPIKVVCKTLGKDQIVITSYPLKQRMQNESEL